MKPSFLDNIWAWGSSASYSDTTVSTWLAGLVLILLLSFLWSTVVRKVAGPAVDAISAS